MTTEKLCRCCNDLIDSRLFPPQSRVCYECKARNERVRVAMKARDDFARLISYAPPGIAAGLKRF